MPGGHHCHCEPGYELDLDLHVCVGKCSVFCNVCMRVSVLCVALRVNQKTI